MPPITTLTRRQVIRIALSGAVAAGGGAAAVGCTSQRSGRIEPTGPLPSDRVVFSVQGWPGLVQPVYRAMTAPELMVYGSGGVIWLEPGGDRALVPGRYLTAHVDPLTVARFAAEATESEPLTTDVDYGMLPTPDLGATTVSLHGEKSDSTTTIGGFFAGYEATLTRRQRRRRDELRDLIDRARRLAVEAKVTDYVPERIVVLEQYDSPPPPTPPCGPGRTHGRSCTTRPRSAVRRSPAGR